MTSLTLDTALQTLATRLDAALPGQIFDPADPHHGAACSTEDGRPDASHIWTTPLLAACALLDLNGWPEGSAGPTRSARALAAADHLLRAQRPSGLIDLPSANYDSSPDTAFVVQLLAAVLVAGRQARTAPAHWPALAGKLEAFIRRATPGLATGGFHTPNHRWVIASALALAADLFRDQDVAASVSAYLAEGPDLDADGAWLERSSAIYDTVSNRAVLLLAERCPADADPLRQAVAANLAFNRALLDTDGTIETALSTRQDRGKRQRPYGLGLTALQYARQTGDRAAAELAAWLWSTPAGASLSECVWLVSGLQSAAPDTALAVPPTAAVVPDGTWHFPFNGLWRLRRGRLAATVLRGNPFVLRLRYGAAELVGLSVAQSYFGTGQFRPGTLEVAGERVTLADDGVHHPRRPGYDLPLGRPVPPEQWESVMPQRGLRRVPPSAAQLTITPTDTGFDLHLQTTAGLAGVLTHIALDFPPGGVWETTDTRIAATTPGQVLFLKSGTGRMQYGRDAIEVAGGAFAHCNPAQRDSVGSGGNVRVLLTFVTPVDHRVSLRCTR